MGQEEIIVEITRMKWEMKRVNKMRRTGLEY
jgi:hypothetical protein